MKRFRALTLLSAMAAYCSCAPEIESPCYDVLGCDQPNQCRTPICDGLKCSLTNREDATLCEWRHGHNGLCRAGECVSFVIYYNQCSGNDPVCSVDDDCYTRPCTHSICSNGKCIHTPYQEGTPCIAIDMSQGACVECACYGLTW